MPPNALQHFGREHFIPLQNIHPTQRIGLFIDGSNLYATARALGFDIDYKRLLKLFSSKATLVRAFYYTALLDEQEYSPIRPLVDLLDYNGYTLVTKLAKEFTDASGRRRHKGNMDIEIAVDMMSMAPRLDHAVLFSGDGDFRRLVESVQAQGVRVSVLSTLHTQPSMVADELRRQADQLIDIADIAPSITREANSDAAPHSDARPEVRPESRPESRMVAAVGERMRQTVT